ncbi:glycerate kinase [Chamaesiphon sp.]|uniref:glycerate kinase type-2 family protein n=1 Tax=Chamaesiphon sp. TaxID=2814140 RepID=UPI0035934F9A
MNDLIDRLIKSALAAVNPFDSIQNHLRLDGEDLVIGDRVINLTNKDIRCVAIGKASVPMARSISALFGSRISQGLVIAKYAHLGDAIFPTNWECIESAHPVPDECSLDAGDRVWEFLADCTDRTLVLACISGGASALAIAPHNWSTLIELLTNAPTVEISQETQQLITTTLSKRSIDIKAVDPRSNISLAALQSIGMALLAGGLSIEKINTVRSRIDRLKGGGLVDRVGAGKVIGLILSDVIGDPIASIAAGLTNHPDADNLLVGNNRQACEAVARTARSMGYNSQIITTELDGEARVRGVEIVREIITHPPNTVLIYGGETTVNLPENCLGKGGRNTELGLAAAIELAVHNVPAWVVTLATDGTDGPTNAAGATVNETTIDRALRLGWDARSALDRHDSYPFFQQLGDLHLIEPTGTNVADITIAIRP